MNDASWWTRREALAACAAALPALMLPTAGLAGAAVAPSPLGFVIHSFAVRGAKSRGSGFADPVRFLDYCRSLGVGGIQVSLGARGEAEADALRARAGEASMYVEGVIAPPRNEDDVARFEAEVRTAKRAGASVVRTVMLPGRRYETFDSTASFTKATERAGHSLALAAPVVARHDVRLAVENHKDWRAEEMIALLDRVGSDHVGVCLDTGNSLALLEDPMDTVAALAPRAFTTHLKDMGVEEHPEGFLLAEVPLGEGRLDLPRVVRAIQTARPGIRFNIEMITRDPLKVPCLTDRYWSTFPGLSGLALARTLTFVRKSRREVPLPRLSALAPDEQLRVEDENLKRCVTFAHEKLGL